MSVPEEDGIKNLFEGTLKGQGWAEECAISLLSIVQEFNDRGAPVVYDLPESAVGKKDPLEAFSRARAGESVSGSLDLLLPASLVLLGAAGGGAFWGYWNGRSKTHAVPAIDHHIGLAPSGAGKSTMHGLLAAAGKAGTDASYLSTGVELQAVVKRMKAAIPKVFADAGVTTSVNPEILDEAKTVEGVMLRAIDKMYLAGLSASHAGGVIADATVEATASLAAQNGGAVTVRSAEQDFLDNTGRYQSKSGPGVSSVSVLTTGWDGDEYARMRQSSGTENVSALVLSLSLLTQNESFEKLIEGPAGNPLITKGVLGRAWVTTAADVSVVDMAAEETARLVRAVNGEEPEDNGSGSESARVRRAYARFGAAAGQSRAIRIAESGLIKWVEKDPKASGLSEHGSALLSKVLTACGLAVGVAWNPLLLGAGLPGAGVAGIRVEVEREDAMKLESLYALCLAILRDSRDTTRILAAALPRVVSKIVRMAVLRTAAIVAADGSDEQWAAWCASGKVNPMVLADTAVRVIPWWLRHHLAAMGGLVQRAGESGVRQAAVEDNGIVDTSLEGLMASRLVQGGYSFNPTPKLSDLVLWLSKRINGKSVGAAWARTQDSRYRAMSQFLTRVFTGEDTSEYFLVK